MKTGSMVHRRCFFHTPGFDPHDPAAQYRRFARELVRFATTWNVEARVTAQHGEQWDVTASALGWQVETTFVLFDWSDIVGTELRRPAHGQLRDGAITFADLLASGTAWRYFAANLRYGVFFLVPFVDVILFAAMAAVAGYFVGCETAAVQTISVPALTGGIAGVAAALLIFAALLRWPGERWRVRQGLADWIFARDYMLGRHAAIAARIETFADRLVECARRADVDEIIVAGHSLGATVAVDLVARAFDRDPALGRHGPKLCLLTIGATIPKLALHPKGAWVRAATRRLAAEPSLTWAEYQARDDIISFHKFDPVKLAPFADVNESGRLVIRRVQFHEMLTPPTLRRYRFNYMRLHYQFVMANERRAAYDYFMLMCGPVPLAQNLIAANGPADHYAPDGSLIGSIETS